MKIDENNQTNGTEDMNLSNYIDNERVLLSWVIDQIPLYGVVVKVTTELKRKIEEFLEVCRTKRKFRKILTKEYIERQMERPEEERPEVCSGILIEFLEDLAEVKSERWPDRTFDIEDLLFVFASGVGRALPVPIELVIIHHGIMVRNDLNRNEEWPLKPVINVWLAIRLEQMKRFDRYEAWITA
ncbi:hypothetical protein [Aureimonas psammosilenae]|uniref:hypothetical protein n=1 Tax=Aureimonas psammosilenae TaxID=2495496 RepID=UPI001260ED3E|nr:hypothetical protein [Aureimonas psammosilenae]